MAKVGKMYFNIPDEFFEQAEESKAQELEDVAQRVASNLRAGASPTGRRGVPDVRVSTKRDRNGRLTKMIVLAEPNGTLQQAKNGVLTRAAAGAGLDVHRYG